MRKIKTDKPAILVLEDGAVFHGRSFGSDGTTSGEVIFNTAMTGYQEILTDPSYRRQIVTMTNPLIGNYGINNEDFESERVQVSGFIVGEYCRNPSNHRSVKSLKTYLQEHNVVAIEGVDTRALTRRLRINGSLRGIVSTTELNPALLREKALQIPSMEGLDLVREVTTHEVLRFPAVSRVRHPSEIRHPSESWDPSSRSIARHSEPQAKNLFFRDPSASPQDDVNNISPQNDVRSHQDDEKNNDKEYEIALLDFGVKHSIIRQLNLNNCHVTVFPADTSAEEISRFDPDGILLSNGPGDPAAVNYAIRTIKSLLGRYPIFGICLGHQLLALALSAKTKKMKFGHHGANHPVKDIESGRVSITSQNHGFCIDPKTLPEDVLVTHINLNDQTIEGISCPGTGCFSVQYHPEAAPGPEENRYLFQRFINLMEHHR